MSSVLVFSFIIASHFMSSILLFFCSFVASLTRFLSIPNIGLIIPVVSKIAATREQSSLNVILSGMNLSNDSMSNPSKYSRLFVCPFGPFFPLQIVGRFSVILSSFVYQCRPPTIIDFPFSVSSSGGSSPDIAIPLNLRPYDSNILTPSAMLSFPSSVVMKPLLISSTYFALIKDSSVGCVSIIISRATSVWALTDLAPYIKHVKTYVSGSALGSMFSFQRNLHRFH